MQRSKNYFVDLFAGCGGLSLGLEYAGFVPAYVNELDASAMESYLINRDAEFPLLRQKYSSYDIQENLTAKKNALDDLSSSFEVDYGIKRGDLGLVVGGPPCQGYSAMGQRRTFKDLARKDIPSNYLYKDMIKVISSLQPKAFIFENVGGLMTGKWTGDGEKGEIWHDVRKAFTNIENYSVHFELVKAKDYGVPQRRPRIIMVGLRDDFSFENDDGLVAKGLLPEQTDDFPNLPELLDDIIDEQYEHKAKFRRSIGDDDKDAVKNYRKQVSLKTTEYPSDASTEIQKTLRTRKDGTVAKKGDSLTEHEYSYHSAKLLETFQYMVDHNVSRKSKKTEGQGLPEHMLTKKWSQKLLPRIWGDDGPNITATSLPDDFVHYAQPRSLTVREWARLQMFPDWYEFSGKRTTGGKRRAGDPSKGDWKRETPKYTQIGNAVPVKLASEIGNHIRKLIL